MGSYYLRDWHMRWFHDHMDEGVLLRDIADEVVGFSLSGPYSRKVIEKLSNMPVGDLPFMGGGAFDIGLIRARVGRLSVAGELGYEIHRKAAEHIGLRKLLLEAGADQGIREIGFNALLSVRLEKSFGIWSAEFTQGYTAAQTGMDRWIDWDKEFVEKAAAMAERAGNGPAQQVVTLEVDAQDADATRFEPIWADGKMVGFVTSGGYGHTVGKSMAMAMINQEHCSVGTGRSVHIVGVEQNARVIAPSPYDPSGKAMRR
jgi:dimethylglycine dehydrogenase